MKSVLIFFCLLLSGFASAQIARDSLVLYLPFDGNANDYSGNSNHGVPFATVNDTNRFGQANTSFRFNGNDSYVRIAPSPSMNRIQKANKVTISAWINIYAWWNNMNVFSIFERYNPATDAGWLFEANIVPGGYLFLANEASISNYAGCAAPTPFKRWIHMAVTYDKAAGRVKFYQNGLLVCNSSYSQPINVGDTTTSFTVGRSLAGPDEYSDGLIDELKVYCRTLDETEIRQIVANRPTLSQVSPDFKITRQGGNSGWKVDFNHGAPPAKVEVLDSQGRILISVPVSASDKSALLPAQPGGLYLVRAKGFPAKKWMVWN